MGRKLIHVIEDLDLVDEIFLEEDGTYLHNIFYKDNPSDSLVNRENDPEDE